MDQLYQLHDTSGNDIVRLLSIKYPFKYVRHSYGKINLELYQENQLFNLDASWKAEQQELESNGKTGINYLSYNKSDFYLGKSNHLRGWRIVKANPGFFVLQQQKLS